MAYSFQREVSDGVRTLYPVNFDFLAQEEIYVYVGGHENYKTQVSYRWADDQTIELTNVGLDLPDNTVFTIRRVVDRTQLIHEFTNGGIRGGAVDQANLQALYLIQEIADGFTTETGAYENQGDLDMNGHAILELFTADDAPDHHAATVGFVKAKAGDYAEEWARQAKASADQAAKDATLVAGLSEDWKRDYGGNGPNFPQDGLWEGILFYYDGLKYTQGLYIWYDHQTEPDTGKWKLVSGVGPQGPKGEQGVEGAPGAKGDQGIQGPQGIQGQQGIQGPIGDTGDPGPQGATGDPGPEGPQGIQGAKGDQGLPGQAGPEGQQGVQGIQGPPGVKGDTGEDGQSFQIDEIGLLADRGNFDAEPRGFTYYATDYEVQADQPARMDRFTADGTTKAYTVSFTPDGQQSLIVSLGGVVQGVDKYTVAIASDVYTVTFTEFPSEGAQVVIREVSISTGYGAIFIKNSDTTGDWSEAIPFGKGPRGDQGPTGAQGPAGVQGPQGDRGPDGVQGPQGIAGNQGIQGPQGAKGDTGAIGPKGPAGDRGPTGIQGPEGARGPTGEQGPQGNAGVRGPQGAQGPTGATGPRGSQGPTGPTGKQGAKGDTGDKGASGADGMRGSFNARLPFIYGQNPESSLATFSLEAIKQLYIDFFTTDGIVRYGDMINLAGGALTDNNSSMYVFDRKTPSEGYPINVPIGTYPWVASAWYRTTTVVNGRITRLNEAPVS